MVDLSKNAHRVQDLLDLIAEGIDTACDHRDICECGRETVCAADRHFAVRGSEKRFVERLVEEVLSWDSAQ